MNMIQIAKGMFLNPDHIISIGLSRNGSIPKITIIPTEGCPYYILLGKNAIEFYMHAFKKGLIYMSYHQILSEEVWGKALDPITERPLIRGLYTTESEGESSA